MDRILFESQNFKVMVEEHEIPWIKVFTVFPFKELSELPKDLKLELFDLVDFIEKEMIQYFQPDKINISSFGNYVPHVHMHVQARFKTDSFFPEPTWGKLQRYGTKILCKGFYELIEKKLKEVRRG